MSNNQDNLFEISDYVSKDDIKNKIDNLNKVIQKYPNIAEYYENRLEIFRSQAIYNDDLGKKIEAIYFWKLALKDIDTYLDINMAIKLNEEESLESEFERLDYLLDNNNAYIYQKLIGRGRIKDRLLDLDGAYEDYKKAIEIINNFSKNVSLSFEEEDKINADKWMLYSSCALIKTRIKEYESSINYYDKALKLYGSNISYIGRAIAKLFLMEHESAFNDLDMAIKLHEEDSLESLKKYQKFYNQTIPKIDSVFGSRYEYNIDNRDLDEFLYKKVSSFLNQYLARFS